MTFVGRDHSSHCEQQLVDCNTVDPGCTGEFVDNAFAFCREKCRVHGANYSCITTKGTCKDSSCTVDIVRRSVTTGYKDVSTVGE